jgi:hypothetical protein
MWTYAVDTDPFALDLTLIVCGCNCRFAAISISRVGSGGGEGMSIIRRRGCTISTDGFADSSSISCIGRAVSKSVSFKSILYVGWMPGSLLLIGRTVLLPKRFMYELRRVHFQPEMTSAMLCSEYIQTGRGYLKSEMCENTVKVRTEQFAKDAPHKAAKIEVICKS